jgi:hypothetical protein
VEAPVIPAKAGIQRRVAKYDLPGLIEKLRIYLLVTANKISNH